MTQTEFFLQNFNEQEKKLYISKFENDLQKKFPNSPFFYYNLKLTELSQIRNFIQTNYFVKGRFFALKGELKRRVTLLKTVADKIR